MALDKATQEKIERIKKAKLRGVNSDLIRVGNSDLYDWDVTRRAVLREIAFMQCTNEKSVEKYIEFSPFKDAGYLGWCIASQRFLANRCGTSEDYVGECVRLFAHEGVIEIRRWNDDHGFPHSEYHIKEDVVTAHQRPKGFMSQERNRPRRGGNKAANKGSFQKDDGRPRGPKPPDSTAISSHVDSHRPSKSTANYRPSSQPSMPSEFAANSEMAVSPSKGVSTSLGGSSVASLPSNSKKEALDVDTRGRGLASAADACGAAGRESGDGVPVLPVPSLKPARETGTITQGVKPPIPNWKLYPTKFKVGVNVDAQGNWLGGKLPKCPWCPEHDPTTLQPREHHCHNCEACGFSGYQPKFEESDMAHRGAMRDQLQENKHQQARLRRGEAMALEFGAEEA